MIISSSIEKLKSVETALSNKFEALTSNTTTQVNDLSSKIIHGIQDMDTGMVIDNKSSKQGSSNRCTLSVELIASMTASILSEDKEKEKRKF